MSSEGKEVNGCKLRLFYILIRAWLIVMLITLNTYLITKGLFNYSLIVGIGIALMWTLNVKDLSVSSWKDRLAYITGSFIGAYISLYHLSKVFN